MVGQSLWKNLKTLVDFDKQLDTVKKEIEKTETILEKDKHAIPKLENYVEECKQKWHAEKKNADLQELDAKELAEKEKEKKKILDTISSQKEYQALEKEIKTLSQQVMRCDDLLVKAWHQLETSKKKFEEEKEAKEKQILQLKEGLEVQKKALQDLKTKKEDVSQKRDSATKVVPAEWFVKYERMKDKVENPIVPLMGTSCSACYYSALRQDLQKLKKGGLVPCRNCYRFLYYDIEEEKEAQQESF